MAQPVPAATLFGVAVVFGLLGYFIRIQHRLSVAAERDADAAPEPTPGRVPSHAALATFAWGLSLCVAGLTALLGVAVALGRATVEVWGWYTVLVVTAILAAATASRMTVRPDSDPETGEDA